MNYTYISLVSDRYKVFKGVPYNIIYPAESKPNSDVNRIWKVLWSPHQFHRLIILITNATIKGR